MDTIHPNRSTIDANKGLYVDFSSSDDSDDHSVAPDFDEIMKKFSNIGGHFMFKHEKESLDSESLKGSLFFIDSVFLKHALATIPFYERLDFFPSFFNSDELEEQDRLASANEETYRKICETCGRNLLKKSSKKCNLPNILKEENVLQSNSNSKDELSRVLEGTKSFSVVERVDQNSNANFLSSAAKETVNKEDMQKWLDSLL